MLFDYGTGKPSPLGMCIKNGIIYGDYMTSYSVMAVKKDGTIYTPAQGTYGKKSSCSRCKRYIIILVRFLLKMAKPASMG